MDRESIFDERRREIGWTNTSDNGRIIHYFTYKHGQVGEFDTKTRQYHRWKPSQGRQLTRKQEQILVFLMFYIGQKIEE